MSQPAAPIDRDLAAWLTDLPERAPAGLLAGVASRAIATPQRPAILALALGTPTMAGAGSRGVPFRHALVLVALGALAIAVAVAAAGGIHLGVVVVPSPSGSTVSSPTASPSVQPAATITAASPDPAATVYEDPILGFQLAYDPAGTGVISVSGAGAGARDPIVTAQAQPCVELKAPLAARACAGIEVWSQPLDGPGVSIPRADGGTAPLRGSTVDALADAWQVIRGPSTRTPVVLDGFAGLELRTASQAPLRVAIVVIRAGRFWLFENEAGTFLPTVTRVRLHELLAGWHWLTSPSPMSVRQLTYPATSARPGFSAWTDATKGYSSIFRDLVDIPLSDRRVCPGQSGLGAAICIAEGGGVSVATITVSTVAGTLQAAVDEALGDAGGQVWTRCGVDVCVLGHLGTTDDAIALVEHDRTVWRVRLHDVEAPGTSHDLVRFLVRFEPFLS